jgi:hypothetical protein
VKPDRSLQFLTGFSIHGCSMNINATDTATLSPAQKAEFNTSNGATAV